MAKLKVCTKNISQLKFYTPLYSGGKEPHINNVGKSNKKRVKKKRQDDNRTLKEYIAIQRAPMDLTFLILTLLLLTIGLIMLFSASYPNAYYLEQNSFYYISRQLVFAAIGVVAMLFISIFDYHILRQFAIPAMVVSVILLILVFAMPKVNDAHRWIFIGPINFQPSEIAKFALVLLFSHLITINYDKMGSYTYGVIPYFGMLGILAGLMIAEPHLSGTIVLVALGVVMLIVGGVKIWHLALSGVIGGGFLLLMIVIMGKTGRMMSRIEHWLDPFIDPKGLGFQTIQSLYAIGSGGLMGAGIGNSRQKYLYLPEPQNDFIFAIVCEELGLIGATIIIVLFALLIWRGFIIAMRAKDKFGSLMAVGLTAQIGIQVILNIAVVTNLVPNTGIGLPFFSSGGTSLLMLLAQMGIVLSISRQSSVEKE